MKLTSLAVKASNPNGAPSGGARRSPIWRIAAQLLLLVAFVTPAPSTQAAGRPPADTFQLHVPAVAEFLGSDCPFVDDWVPEAGQSCTDWYILFFREGQPFELRHAPWRLFVVRTDFILEPDGNITPLYEAWGLLENPQGRFDEKKYTFAQVSGIVPMSDGSDLVVDLTWDMALAELHHGGNNSAFNPSNGIDRHYNDRCITIIQNAHQQWRWGAPGQITGSIGSVDVNSLYRPDDEPFIAGRSVFTYVTAEHGACSSVTGN